MNYEYLKSHYPNYEAMVKWCTENHIILNNSIRSELEQQGYMFEPYCGQLIEYTDSEGNELTEEEAYRRMDEGEDIDERYKDIYQEYIINEYGAEAFKDHTNEIVLYCEQLELYLLCVTHWGTPWSGVPENWKEAE